MNLGKSEFTYSYYEEFLSRLKEYYTFISFREGKDLSEITGNSHAILRHDIDMDPGLAVRLSEIEADLGIVSTYFFMIRTPLYNVFSETGTKQVKEILDNGHIFGLHFDCAVYKDIANENVDSYVNGEISFLETYFDHSVEAVSFHRPGTLELGGMQLKELPNTYEKVFLEKFSYFSDSRGEWAKGNPIESETFSEQKNMHILTHPVWWNDTIKTPYQCLEGILEHCGEQAEQYISENCQVWNRDKSA